MRKQVPETYRDLTPKQFHILQWVLNKIWNTKVGEYSIVMSGFDKTRVVPQGMSIQEELLNIKDLIDRVFDSCVTTMDAFYVEFHPQYQDNTQLPFVIYNDVEHNGVDVEMVELNDEWMSACGSIQLPTTKLTQTQSLAIAYVLGQLTNPSSDVAFYLLDCPYLTKADLNQLYQKKQIKSVQYVANNKTKA